MMNYAGYLTYLASVAERVDNFVQQINRCLADKMYSN